MNRPSYGLSEWMSNLRSIVDYTPKAIFLVLAQQYLRWSVGNLETVAFCGESCYLGRIDMNGYGYILLNPCFLHVDSVLRILLDHF